LKIKLQFEWSKGIVGEEVALLVFVVAGLDSEGFSKDRKKILDKLCGRLGRARDLQRNPRFEV
jgi:hypothetical protein